ncbi:MAG TPA: cupin domain-containing protein [Xanthobacteraceae bacterium]|nr:cupin domain-containing protein [Xanthobacteraceae bacterium]
MQPRYFVQAGDVPAYSPANHHGTLNRRLIGPSVTGAKQLEVVHGTLQPGKGALAHAHPGIEQVCYVLEGMAVAEIAGERRTLGPGDCCFFPADTPHVFTATGETPAKILVIYSPPYEENPARVVRASASS